MPKINKKTSQETSGKEMISFLRSLWEFHILNVMLPRSSSYELMVTSLAAISAPSPIFAEYGPYTGHTSFYLTSIASKLGGKAVLVDNYRQFRVNGLEIPADRFEKILRANVGILPNNRFSVINKDVFVDHSIGIDPGLIYYDICQHPRSAEVVHEIVMENDQPDRPVMIIIDDAVQKHHTNEKFYERWNELWSTTARNHMKPFFLTGNRLFLANYEVSQSFFDAIGVMERFNYIANSKKVFDSYDWKTMWYSEYKIQRTTKSDEFLEDTRFWSSLADAFPD